MSDRDHKLSRSCCRLFAVVLWSAVLMLALASTAFAAGNTTEFAGGTGTVDDPYLISTKTHLNNVRNYLDANYKMTGGISFTSADFASGGEFYNGGAGWKPIGDASKPFTGTFDGGEYRISGLKINLKTSAQSYVGLFGYVKYAGLKNIQLTNNEISFSVSNTTATSYVGSVVGYVDSKDSKWDYAVYNCSHAGSVSVTMTNYLPKVAAGGIAGGVTSGTEVRSCKNTGAVSATKTAGNVGGIAGRGGKIVSCNNTGRISGTDWSSASGYGCVAGGIVGYGSTVEKSYNKGTVSGGIYAGGISGCYGGVSESYNSGTVSGDGYAGGIIGYTSDISVKNCYNTGNVSAATSGGIIGCGGKIFYCYNVGVVTGKTAVGGICGENSVSQTWDGCYYLNQNSAAVGAGSQAASNSAESKSKSAMKQQSTFAAFDFTNIWNMSGNLDYPYPELKNCSMVYTKTLRNLIVTSMPTKTVYYVGETFDRTGLEVTAYYDNDTSVKVTPTISFNSSTVGKKSVGLSYGGKTIYITVDVVEPAYEQVHCICGKTTCSGTGHDAKQEWFATETLPTEAGYWCLTEDVVLDGDGWSPEDGTYLCLNGHTITAERGVSWQEVWRMIEVDSGVTFTLTDCGTGVTHGYIDTDHLWKTGDTVPSGATEYDITGGVITNGTSCGVDVEGTFIMYGGTICGNGTENSGNGAGVNAAGTFNLHDGTICGNTANNGAGVYVNDGGAMTMTGGLITDNYAVNEGGGVLVYGNSYNSNVKSTLNLSGGTICGNVANHGGGIAAEYQGIVTMTGGSITGNAAPLENGVGGGGGAYVSVNSFFEMSGGSVSENYSSDYGGGFYLDQGSNAVLAISGGEICENVAVSTGGGIAVQSGNTVAVTGGLISENQVSGAYRGGGGIYCDGLLNLYGGTIADNQAEVGSGIGLDRNGAMNVKGAPVVADNTHRDGIAENYNGNGTAITVVGELSSGARIGVSAWDKNIIVVKDAAYEAQADDYKDCFFSDDETLHVEVYTDGTSLVLRHRHDYGEWTQTKAPTYIDAGEESRVCKVEGCNETETRPVDAIGSGFIADVELTYNETEHTAELSNVPEDIIVVLAVYQNEQMVLAQMKSSQNGAISFDLQTVPAMDTLKAFFVMSDWRPVGPFKVELIESETA